MQESTEQQVYSPNDFLMASKLANVNCLEMVRSLQSDHLVMKLAGFADSLTSAQSTADAPSLRDALTKSSQDTQATSAVCFQYSAMFACHEGISGWQWAERCEPACASLFSSRLTVSNREWYLLCVADMWLAMGESSCAPRDCFEDLR